MECVAHQAPCLKGSGQGVRTSLRVSYTATKVAMLMTPSSVGSSPRNIRDLQIKAGPVGQAHS